MRKTVKRGMTKVPRGLWQFLVHAAKYSLKWEIKRQESEGQIKV